MARGLNPGFSVYIGGTPTGYNAHTLYQYAQMSARIFRSPSPPPSPLPPPHHDTQRQSCRLPNPQRETGRYRRWCGTWNNRTADVTIRYLSDMQGCIYAIAGNERAPTTGLSYWPRLTGRSHHHGCEQEPNTRNGLPVSDTPYASELSSRFWKALTLSDAMVTSKRISPTVLKRETSDNTVLHPLNVNNKENENMNAGPMPALLP